MEEVELITKLQGESSVLDRVIYKNKNQHRRSHYLQYLLKVRRDLKLLEVAKLSQILDALCPITGRKRPAEKALIPCRRKRKTELQIESAFVPLGVDLVLFNISGARNKALVQRSVTMKGFPVLRGYFQRCQNQLLRQQPRYLCCWQNHFSWDFRLWYWLYLERIRVIVQQMLLDVVTVFNKVSEISQRKQTVKLTEDGIEALEILSYTVLLSFFYQDQFVETRGKPSNATLFDSVSSGDQTDDMNDENNIQIENPNILKQQEEKRKMLPLFQL